MCNRNYRHITCNSCILKTLLKQILQKITNHRNSCQTEIDTPLTTPKTELYPLGLVQQSSGGLLWWQHCCNNSLQKASLFEGQPLIFHATSWSFSEMLNLSLLCVSRSGQTGSWRGTSTNIRNRRVKQLLCGQLGAIKTNVAPSLRTLDNTV